MKSRIGTFESNWLLAPEGRQPAVETAGDDLVDRFFEMPGRAGRATISRYILPAGLAMSRARSFYERIVPGRVLRADPVVIEFPHDTLFIQNLRSGINTLFEAVSGQTVVYCRGQLHVRVQRRLELINAFHGDEQVDLYSMSVPLPALEAMLGADLARQLLDGLGLDGSPLGRVVPAGSTLLRILYQGFEGGFQGRLLKLYLQAKALEFLTQLCASMVLPETKADALDAGCGNPTMPRPLEPRPPWLEELRKYLTALNGELPTLTDLAQRCGVSLRTMTSAFQHHYDASVYRFLLEVRLEQARDALASSDIPIKVVAARLGYRHVASFNHAFKRHFGYSPGELRR